MKKWPVALLLVASFITLPTQGMAANGGKTVNTSEVRAEIDSFLAKELVAHLAAIKTLEPPPDRILNVPTTGEFSWGTFMRALAVYAEMTGTKELAGRDLAKWVGQIGLIEARAGSKAFSQMYAAMALRHFGRDLNTNPLWQQLSSEEQTAWRSLLNPERFYNPKTNQVIDLAENYLGVAARIASIGFDLGLSKDRAFLDKLIDRAALQFTLGNLYADDSPPHGRYDRYSNEYARYVWEAAEMAGREDVLEKLTPSLKTQMKVWWDLVSEDGYGYNWGRSQGVVSYLDTPEIVGFLATHPKFRPAPLGDIAALYYQAWKYLRRDYRDDAHLLSIFSFGRGNYAYISREREWQQTTGFFGKLANNHRTLMTALEKEGLATFPIVPSLPDVTRFEFFRQSADRSAGVWLVRSGPLRFALPITTGPRPGAADYLPAPHGLPGFASPVEMSYPSMTPFIELADGRKVVATDGADEIKPGIDGRSLLARWNKWALVGGKPSQFVDIGLTCEVVWRVQGGTLSRVETLSGEQPVSIKSWQLVVPSSYASVQTQVKRGQRLDVFSADANTLEVSLIDPSHPVSASIFATGNSSLGKGVRGHIPLHLSFEARDFSVMPARPFKYRLDLRASISTK